MCHGVGKMKHLVPVGSLIACNWLVVSTLPAKYMASVWVHLLSKCLKSVALVVGCTCLWCGLVFLRAAWWEKFAKLYGVPCVPFLFLVDIAPIYPSFVLSLHFSHFAWIMYPWDVYIAPRKKFLSFLSCDNSSYAASVVEDYRPYHSCPLRILNLAL